MSVRRERPDSQNLHYRDIEVLIGDLITLTAKAQVKIGSCEAAVQRLQERLQLLEEERSTGKSSS
ncbi:MAG: hypothetical protein ACI4XL_06705 [Bacillus sp. (in: firmicutes)]